MTKRKPAKIKTTAVPDRSPGATLGHEARILANALQTSIGRAWGDEGAPTVPAVTDPAWAEWFKTLNVGSLKVPVGYLAWAVAILRQIPDRDDRPQGRPPDPAIKQAEVFTEALPVIEAARFVAATEDWKAREKAREKAEALAASQGKARPVEKEPSKGELEERAQQLEERSKYIAKKLYERRGKGDIPKQK